MAPDLNVWALIFEKGKANNESGIIVSNKWKKRKWNKWRK